MQTLNQINLFHSSQQKASQIKITKSKI